MYLLIYILIINDTKNRITGITTVRYQKREQQISWNSRQINEIV